MRYVFFDLGDTLETVANGVDVLLAGGPQKLADGSAPRGGQKPEPAPTGVDVLRRGAKKMRADVSALRNNKNPEPKLGLISDFTDASSPAEIPQLEGEYRQIIEGLGIDGFFQPFAKAVTLSTQVG